MEGLYSVVFDIDLQVTRSDKLCNEASNLSLLCEAQYWLTIDTVFIENVNNNEIE